MAERREDDKLKTNGVTKQTSNFFMPMEEIRTIKCERIRIIYEKPVTVYGDLINVLKHFNAMSPVEQGFEMTVATVPGDLACKIPGDI